MVSRKKAQDFINMVVDNLCNDNLSEWDRGFWNGSAKGFLTALEIDGYSKEDCLRLSKTVSDAYVDGSFLKEIGNNDVFERYVNHQAIKEDLPYLVSAKWRSMKKRVEDTTMEDALICVLQILDSNDNHISLSDEEYKKLIGGENNGNN